MNSTNTYLAVFTGSKTGTRHAAWEALSEAERGKKQQEGMVAWQNWAKKHAAAVVTMGGPLGKTIRVSNEGAIDTSNALAAFTIVRADSHAAAARMFENHPHFAIFPGDAVEIMPIMDVPGG